MTQATYAFPGNRADPAGGVGDVSQEFTALRQARGAVRACRIEFVGSSAGACSQQPGRRGDLAACASAHPH
jgi:hypothetical protein